MLFLVDLGPLLGRIGAPEDEDDALAGLVEVVDDRISELLPTLENIRAKMTRGYIIHHPG